MEDSTYWWLAAGVLVAAELVSGTFYLLMLAGGMMAAALSAHLGWPPHWQWTSAAIVGGASVMVWRRYRLRQGAKALEDPRHQVTLDLGESVQVTAWRDDRTASVKYRGAQWEAVLMADQIAEPGHFVIKEVVGNRLHVAKLEAQ